MMDLGKALENIKFDVRMKDWNMKHGVLKETEQAEHIKNLKDMSAQSVPLEFQEETPDSFS
jgi:hypothetical protein